MAIYFGISGLFRIIAWLEAADEFHAMEQNIEGWEWYCSFNANLR